MAEASIPVDLFNPGQVFACLGFLEAAEVLLGQAEGSFDWTDPARTMFSLRADGDANPFASALEFIANASVEWLGPDGVEERDGGPTISSGSLSPSRAPSAAELPARLSGSFLGRRRLLTLGYWADSSSRWHVTFKRPTNGSSCHVRWRTTMEALRRLGGPTLAGDPLNAGAPTESSFRLDPRGYADSLGAGASPDKLRKGGIAARVKTYPACEALAVLGLEFSRPARLARLAEPACDRFGYCVWAGYAPPPLARTAIGTTLAGWPGRRFAVGHAEVKRGGDQRLLFVAEEDPLYD
jgi:CRISPR-associated protein Csb3